MKSLFEFEILFQTLDGFNRENCNKYYFRLWNLK